MKLTRFLLVLSFFGIVPLVSCEDEYREEVSQNPMISIRIGNIPPGAFPAGTMLYVKVEERLTSGIFGNSDSRYPPGWGNGLVDSAGTVSTPLYAQNGAPWEDGYRTETSNIYIINSIVTKEILFKSKHLYRISADGWSVGTYGDFIQHSFENGDRVVPIDFADFDAVNP